MSLKLSFQCCKLFNHPISLDSWVVFMLKSLASNILHILNSFFLDSSQKAASLTLSYSFHITSLSSIPSFHSKSLRPIVSSKCWSLFLSSASIYSSLSYSWSFSWLSLSLSSPFYSTFPTVLHCCLVALSL